MTVRLTRRTVGNGVWACDSWAVTAVGSNRAATTASGPALSVVAGADEDHYDWQGLVLQLYRDERAAYRFNLSARTPRLFVYCDPDDNGRMVPRLVTASQDVAASYMDGSEEHIYSIDMPEALQCWIEAFIARHGEPEIQLGKSRRRQRTAKQKDADSRD